MTQTLIFSGTTYSDFLIQQLKCFKQQYSEPTETVYHVPNWSNEKLVEEIFKEGFGQKGVAEKIVFKGFNYIILRVHWD